MGEKRVYDLAFGVGGTCRCSMSLRAAGLQYHSFPFDWTGGPAVDDKIALLCRDFEGWMRRESFVKVSENRFDHSAYWRDDALGYYFVHEFDNRKSIDEQLPVVRERLIGRGRRLQQLIGTAKRVLVVFVETPDFGPETIESVAKARERLQVRWPGIAFDMLLIQHEDDIAPRAFREEERDGVRRIVFDYRDRHERGGKWMADHVRLGKWLAARYSVPDYRTPEERREWKARKRKDKLARFAATGWIDYFITKYRYKLYVHLRKRMERKGLI